MRREFWILTEMIFNFYFVICDDGGGDDGGGNGSDDDDDDDDDDGDYNNQEFTKYELERRQNVGCFNPNLPWELTKNKNDVESY